MIKLFSPTEKIFNNNGIKILHPLKCDLYKEDNGDYYIELEDSINNIDYYQPNYIITCPTPFPEGVQAFRIINPEKNKKKIVLKARHVYFDSANYIIKDSYIDEKNCGYALDHLNSNCDIQSPFITSSNIQSINSYRCVRNSLEEAISTIIERWDGHLIRDNFNISVNSTIGTDRGVTLRYGKNITDIKSKEDWNNVVTKILPVGKDGLLLPEIYLEIEEELYDIPFTKVVSFEQDLEQGEYTEEEYTEALIIDLREKAQEYLQENKYPKVNYALSAHLETITDVGDIIYVEHPKLNLSLETHVISIKYDVISKKFKNIEFGNFRKTLKNLLNNISSTASNTALKISNDTKFLLEEELKKATAKIWNTMGNSYVIYDGDKLLVVDQLPKEEARHCLMINSSGIGFSEEGINGTFNSAWQIDGTLDMQKINVINLVADMIKGGTLKLGGENNTNGTLEVYDNEGNLILKIDNNGFMVTISNTQKRLPEILEILQTNQETIQENLNDNYYQKTTINQLIQNAETGVTNTFSEAGGNNIFKNTGLWNENHFEDREDNPYEFFYGKVASKLNDKASNSNSLLLQEGEVYQEQEVPNGNYCISFKYKKLIELSNVYVKINENQYELTELIDTEFQTGKINRDGEYIIQPLIVNSRHIKVSFFSDTNNACEIYDLMVNAGTVKLAYSQNQNETHTETVNIGKGISIKQSDKKVEFRADADGTRILNKSGEVTTEYTETGSTTNNLKVRVEAEIVKVLVQDINNQTVFNRV